MKRNISFILLIGIFILSLSGCKSGEKAAQKYKIYDLNAEKNAIVYEYVKIKNNDKKKMAQDLIAEMSKKSKDSNKIRPILPSFSYQNIKYDDENKNLTISFDRNYYTLSEFEEILVRASITLTMLQIKGIEEVTFNVEHEPLKLADGKVVGAMDKSSFVISLTGNDSVYQTANLLLYYPREDGKGLITEKRNVSYASNLSLERVVIKNLSKKPEKRGAIPTLDDKVQILNINVADGVCYLNLSSNFMENLSDEALKIRVYSIVNSLCNLERVNRVQISVGGENLSLSMDKEVKDFLYMKDESLVKNGK